MEKPQESRLSDATIGYNPATDDGGPPAVTTKRPPQLDPPHRDQLAAIDLCDRIIGAAQECRRQLLTDEVDTSFVPAGVLRQLHVYVRDRPDVTAAAVVGKAVTMLFRNFLNIEEVSPRVARVILAGRTIEPVAAVVEEARYEVLDAGGLVLLTTGDRDEALREAGHTPGATVTERR